MNLKTKTDPLSHWLMHNFFKQDMSSIQKSILTRKWNVKLHSVFISPLGSVNVAQMTQLIPGHFIWHSNLLRICSWDNIYASAMKNTKCYTNAEWHYYYSIEKSLTFHRDCDNKWVRWKPDNMVDVVKMGLSYSWILRSSQGTNKYLTFGPFKSKSNRPRTSTTSVKKVRSDNSGARLSFPAGPVWEKCVWSQNTNGGLLSPCQPPSWSVLLVHGTPYLACSRSSSPSNTTLYRIDQVLPIGWNLLLPRQPTQMTWYRILKAP